jgi:cob(I)alamin adenosyltransferase
VSIVTKTGDDGTTALMYGRRVPKSHPRVAACGAVDELNAALGLARSQPGWNRHGKSLFDILSIQKDLVGLMGELATLDEDMPRYVKDGFAVVSSESVARLDSLASSLEGTLPPFKDWVMPGEDAISAALDFARTVCRRAERHVCELEIRNAHVRVFLNRLSDVLWLVARAVEATSSKP